MQINGFGELKDLRKAVTQKDASVRAYKKQAASESPAPPPADAVELSGASRLLGQLSGVPELRQEKIDAIKSEIEKGEYLTDERVRDGVRRLLEEM